MRNRTVHVLKWGNLLLILITLLCYASPYVNPQHIWYFALLGLAYPVLLIANAAFSLFWLAIKNRYFLFSAFCILLGIGHLNGLIGIKGLFLQVAPPEGEALKVVSFNCGNIITRGSFRRAKPEVWHDGIAAMEADIICLQEFPTKYSHRRYFQPYLEAFEKFPYSNDPNKKNRELAIFSKHPIVEFQVEEFENSINGYSLTDVDWDGQIIRVINVHLQSIAISATVDRIAEDGKIQKKDTWRSIKKILRRFRNGVKERAAQSELIAGHIRNSPYPVIVCGDFNDVPQSYAYRQMARGLQDSFQKAGTGWGSTYAGKIPLLRIDYILASPFFGVCQAGVIRDNPTSDHHAVWAILSR